MKKVVFSLLLLPALISCGSSDQKAPGGTLSSGSSPELTTIEWVDSTTQTLAPIKEGDVVEITYRFKNTGTKNLVIEQVNAGCGCTVAEKPEKPIPPGGTDVIKAKFDSHGKPNHQEKHIAVVANTEPQKDHMLYFKVDVSTN